MPEVLWPREMLPYDATVWCPFIAWRHTSIPPPGEILVHRKLSFERSEWHTLQLWGRERVCRRVSVHAFDSCNYCSAGSSRCGWNKVTGKPQCATVEFITSTFTVCCCCCCGGEMWDAEESGAVQSVYRQKLWPNSWSWILSRLVDVKSSSTLQATNSTHSSTGWAGRVGNEWVSRTTILA